jgi:hypothetical protein
MADLAELPGFIRGIANDASAFAFFWIRTNNYRLIQEIPLSSMLDIVDGCSKRLWKT